MAYTWTIENILVAGDHNLAIVFVEHDDATGESWRYQVTKDWNTTKAEVASDLKRQVLAKRAIRTKIENIKSQIDVATIEAYINS